MVAEIALDLNDPFFNCPARTTKALQFTGQLLQGSIVKRGSENNRHRFAAASFCLAPNPDDPITGRPFPFLRAYAGGNRFAAPRTDPPLLRRPDKY
jgi:hypothetical protein